MAKKAVLGLELNTLFLQVSYAAEGATPVTLKMPGENALLQIPLAAGRQKETGALYFGRDAEEKITAINGEMTTDLLTGLGSEVRLCGETYTHAYLLHQLLQYALQCAAYSAEQLEKEPVEFVAMALSVEPFPEELIGKLEEALGDLPIDREHIYLQGHEESLFSYLIHQPEKLLGYVTGVFDLTNENMVSYCMEMNPKTSPVVTSVRRDDRTGIVKKKHYPSITEHDRALEELDERLCSYVEEFTEGRIVTSIYLIGEGFKKDWYAKSRHLLCRNRKVYAGNNLFSKGAAYSAAGRIWPGTEKEDFLFLGRDMLRCNVGMKAVDDGKEIYLPLLDAGCNYYEAKSETEILLSRPDEIRLLITPIFTGKTYEEIISIEEEEAERIGRSFRFMLCLDMRDVSTLRVRIRDEGFGNFFEPLFAEKEYVFELRE